MSRRRLQRPLPAPCPECRPYDGNWRLVEVAGSVGRERCECARGKARSRAKWMRQAKQIAFDGRMAAAGEKPERREQR